MDVRDTSEGFSIYTPDYQHAKAALHASFVAGECRCSVSFFDGVTAPLIDVPFARALNAIQGVGFPKPEPGHGC